MGEILESIDNSDQEALCYDSDDNANLTAQLYDNDCSAIVNQIIKLNGQLFLFNMNKALFVPIAVFAKFKMTLLYHRISISDDHIWDFNLQVGDATEPMKLIWIMEHREPPIPLNRFKNIRYAFNYLQPNYLRYLDKPFWNPDVFTQVNLVLDYHMAMKRRRGIEILTICDLIKFKMAIDDNRYEYMNCEFHKIIDRTLKEIIESGVYTKNDKFDLNKYLADRQIFRNIQEIFEYLVHNFQSTIGSIYWSAYAQYPIKLSDIISVPTFLKKFRATGTMQVREIDSSGECAKVLYEILTKSKNFIELTFDMDEEWIYREHDLIDDIVEPLARCAITIVTKNSFNFIENFINWLKLAFGTRTRYFFELRIERFATIKSYVFNRLQLKELEIRNGKLDAKLVRMLNTCKTERIYFINCRIANDHNERYEFIQRRSVIDQNNIFKLFDDLQNVGFITLELEEHTIGTLYAYVASIMMVNNLNEYQIKNQFWIPNEYKFVFIRNWVNSELDRIDAYSRRTGDQIDFYQLVNQLDLKLSDRDEFDFYD